MAERREVDAVVIGAGPAGEVCAGRLGEAGLETVLVERELVGGECSYYACMPSKALLRPGALVDEVRRVPGVKLSNPPIDAPRVLARRDEVVHDLDDSAQLPWLEERGVTLLRGQARLEGERTVRVGEDVVDVRRAVVLATGSGALLPPIPGLAEAAPWSNREVTTAPAVPGRLLVLGGGVVGVEMAQAWAALGASVALVEALPRLIAREEEFASEQVAEGLDAAGVDVRLGAKATGVSRGEGGQVRLELGTGASLTGDELLVAIGRRPQTTDLGIESVGLEPGKPVEVDDRMQANGSDWLYAIGDVNGRALLTHAGKYQGRVAADNILGRDARATADGPGTPRVIFTDPEVAAVGHTLATARDAGPSVRAVDHPTNAVAGGSFHGRNAPGLARIVIDEDRDVLVGATFTGPDVAEMLHAATVAVVGEVPVSRLVDAIPSFPTRSEVWLRLLEKDGR
jgi:pyruvate/2-oxoglutarate dehydrogenase complex dihydrolipoamide dehydrogenase (E3) component